jgi:ribosomal protein S18 acetylase RimI-like enzyme
MKPLISESYGWDENLQRVYAVDSLLGHIVLVGGQPIGVLTLSDWCDQFHVTWMAVCPSFQGRGLGSALIAHCQRLAAEAGKPLTLQVLRTNPALKLYERCGFQVYDQDESDKLLMRWLGDRH